MPTTRPGFTLIELLVVVAVVALLAGLLMPILSIAREGARKINCLGYLRQFGPGIQAYMEDNRGYLPPQNWCYDLTGPGTGVGQYNWPDYVAMYIWGAGSPRDAQLVLSQLTVGKASFGSGIITTNIFRCPKPSNPQRTTFNSRSDYGVNQYIFGNCNVRTADPNNPLRPAPFMQTTRLAMIANPAATYGVADTLGCTGTWYYPSSRFNAYKGWNGESNLGYLDPRHTNAVNMLFLDWHAQGVARNDLTMSSLPADFDNTTITSFRKTAPWSGRWSNLSATAPMQ